MNHNNKEYRMTTTRTEMRSTWLIQRLDPPRRTTSGPFGGDNPFSFGGGLRNGGLSPEAMDLLRGIFSFDYMGAAEFEFGALPKTLQGLADDADQLATATVSIPLKSVPQHWTDKSADEPEGAARVYILARSAHLSEVRKRVRSFAKRDYNLKEATRLPEVLRPAVDQARWKPDTCGWLELDNGFMFFTDRDMWAATCALFGVEVAA